MQLPLIKDGLVVNVVELEPETACVDKAKHKEMSAAEDAEHGRRMDEWRAIANAHTLEIEKARQQLLLAHSAALAVKTAAKETKPGAEKAALDRILFAENEVEQWRAKVAELQGRPLPPRPKMERAKRWFYPDGHEVGPEGGNIGDLWDGKTYTRPAKEKAA